MARLLFHVTLAALCVAAVLWRCTVATSDPIVSLCNDVCWEEEAIAQQCIQDMCSRKRNRPRAFRKCKDACSAPVDPCLSLCFRHALSKLPGCQRKCHPSENFHPARGIRDHCEWSCLIDAAMRMKAKVLPKDYIGFTPK